MSDPRGAELAANLEAIRDRITAACTAAGRDPADVTLVAVSKTWPAADVLRLAALGIVDFGESFDQEARPKSAAVGAAGIGVRWHFVGRLQRNKCRSVAGYASAVHSVDRAELVAALGAAAHRAEASVDAYVQLSYDGDFGRGGASREDVPALADAVAAQPGLRLAGVMVVAPPDVPARAVFAAAAALRDEVSAVHPGARALSAGMTGDLEEAIAEGATHVRVGTALFGGRGAATG